MCYVMHTILAGVSAVFKISFHLRYIYSLFTNLLQYTLFAPKILHNLSFFSFLLGITVIPREIKDNAYAKFWGATRCIMGDVKMANGLLHDLTVNYLLLLSLIYSSIPFWPHKLETLVLFTFSFCLLVYCFAFSVVVVLAVMRHLWWKY